VAAAKYHVLAGFVTFTIFAVAYFIHFNFFSVKPSLLALLSDYKWITLGLFLSLFGSTLPDYDLLYKYLSPWHHRSAITHSALIPTIALLVYFYPTPLHNYAILVVCFMLGFASHLFLDYFPSVDIEKLIWKTKYAEAADAIISSLLIGLTPVERLSKEDLKKLSGTFNIHFPQKIPIGKKMRKTLTPKLTRIWLISNGMIVLAYSTFLFAILAPRLLPFV
jgi:membrane-bound metal-dependent hydrolase YbcI (DUF457 family)